MKQIKTTRNMGSFVIGKGLLERAMYFPEGHRVVNAEWDESAGSLRIYIEGDTLPEVRQIGLVPELNPQIVTHPTLGFGPPSYEWIWNPVETPNADVDGPDQQVLADQGIADVE
jgi:hypothetical protein